MKKTHYDKAFKEGAIKLAESSGKYGSEIAKDLGISPSLLYSWLKSNRQPKEVKAAMAQLTKQEQEIKALKQALKIIQEERDILKKAAAYFARQQA